MITITVVSVNKIMKLLLILFFFTVCTQQFSEKIFKTTKIVLSVPLTKKDVVVGLILEDNICDLGFNNLVFNYFFKQ